MHGSSAKPGPTGANPDADRAARASRWGRVAWIPACVGGIHATRGIRPHARFPRFTNEVQHQSKVLPWDATTRSLVLKTGVNWPDLYAQGCSLRQIATALDRAPSTIARELKRNASRQQGYRPRYAQEQARARRWGGARLDRSRRACARRSSRASNKAGRPSRSRAGSGGRPAGPSSPTRPSIASSTPRPRAPSRVGLGATTSPALSGNGAGAGAAAAVLPPSSTSGVPWRNGPPRPPTARPRAIGKPI